MTHLEELIDYLQSVKETHTIKSVLIEDDTEVTLSEIKKGTYKIFKFKLEKR